MRSRQAGPARFRSANSFATGSKGRFNRRAPASPPNRPETPASPQPETSIMRVTITGNLGYVGTVMTPLLKAEGHEVWGYDTGFYGDCILGELGETGVDRQQLKDIRDAE